MGTFRARPEWYGDRLRLAPYSPIPRPGISRKPDTDDPNMTAWLLAHPDYDQPNRPCGARTPTGRFCGGPTQHGEAVCEPCMTSIFRAGYDHPSNKRFVLERVGEIERHNALRRAEGAAKQAAERAASARAEQRQRDAIHVVYYVRTGVNLVKIGTTGDMRQRIKGIYSDMSCLLALEPGGRDLEKQRHRELRKWRFDANPRSEKFAEGPEVRAQIDAVLAEHGDPIAWLEAAEAERDQATTEEAESA